MYQLDTFFLSQIVLRVNIGTLVILFEKVSNRKNKIKHINVK